MSEETNKGANETPSKPKSRMMMIAIIGLCIVAGGGAGVFAVAPLMGGTHADPVAEEAEGRSSGHGSSGHGKSSSSGPHVHSVANLVLNPLNTNGTRFLLVSAAFEVRDAELIRQMEGRDSELRDLLNRTLGSRTVEELSDLAQREPLRAEIQEQMEEMFGAGSVRKVYLPQFVIQ
jgi:flagellar FliL protein